MSWTMNRRALCAAALLLAACADDPEPGPVTPPADMSSADQRDQDRPDQGQPDQGADQGRADQGRADQGQADQGLADQGSPDQGQADQGVDQGVEPGQESLQVTVSRAQIQVSWQVQPAAKLRLLRRAGAPVADAQDPDAEVLLDGLARSLAHPTRDLVPEPQRYYYALFACDAQGQGCQPAAPAQSLSLTLTQALQGGGYTLIWRHASASTCGDRTDLGIASMTSQPDWWRSCESTCAMATARQLTDPAATNEMNAVKTYMQGRQVPFSRVLSSEFCRCFRTAEGFELGPAVELNRALTYYVYEEGQRCANTYALLNTPPQGATNVAMVSHAGFSCPTLDSLAWGEAAIFKPDPSQANPLLIRRVRADLWPMLP